MKYKSEWKPRTLNKKYWKEVLVGRTITKIIWNSKGIDSFILDNNEKVFLVGKCATVGIMTDK